MADEKQLIDIEALSHFKAKQDNENAKKFKSKDDATDLKGAVRYDAAQKLTEEEKAQARANIGAGTGDGTGSAEGAVRHDVQQALDDDDKARARENIGAGTSNFDGDYNSLSNRTHYKEGVNITWNGDQTGRERIIVISSEDWCAYTVKIQDEPLPDINCIIGATIKQSKVDSDNGEITVFSDTLTSEMLLLYNDDVQLILWNDAPVMFNVKKPTSVTLSGITITFESFGVYFYATNLLPSGETIEYLSCISSLVYHPLEDGFIPDTIPRLDENGKLSIDNMPDLGFYDDVVEGYFNAEDNLIYEDTEFTKAITGERGKIYLDVSTNNTYRFSGSIFIRINPDEYTIATNADIDALFT